MNTSNRVQPGIKASLVLVAALAAAGCGSDSESSAKILEKLEEIDKRLTAIEGGAEASSTPRTTSPNPLLETRETAARPEPVARVDDPPAASADATAAPGHPVAVVDDASHDFGSAWAGPFLDHVFTIRNDGGEPLEISKVTPGCGCPVVGEYTRSIPPGDSGRIPIRLKTAQLKGNKRKAVTVESNDPSSPRIVLTLLGDFKPSIEYESFVLIQARPGDGAMERRVPIRNRQDDPLELELRPVENDKLAVDLVETVPGKGYDLVIAVQPPYEVGYDRADIILDTNLPEPKTLTVRANFRVPERLDIVPAQLMVTRTSAGESARELTLTNYGDRPVMVISADVDDEAVTASVSAQEAGREYRVKVTFPDGYEPPASGRTLTLRTDDEEKPLLEVPIKPVAATPSPSRRPAAELLGKVAPSFVLLTVDGGEVSSDEFSRHPATVLNFFAPNCGYCKRQIPSVEKVRSRYQDRGVRFVNISETMGKTFPTDEVLGVLQTLGSRLEVAVDEGNEVGESFEATGYPTLFVVDRSGTIRHVSIGARADVESALSEKLDELLN